MSRTRGALTGLAGLMLACATPIQQETSSASAGNPVAETDSTTSQDSPSSPDTAPQPSEQPQPPGQQQAQGRVRSIDREHGTFQIWGSDQTFVITPSTEIMKNDCMPATLSNIYLGDHAIVLYSNAESGPAPVDVLHARSGPMTTP